MSHEVMEKLLERIALMKQRGVAEEAEMQETAVSKIKDRKQGFSVKSARRAAPLVDVAPAALYAASQAAAISSKRASGELSDPQLLRAVAGVLKGLDEFSEAEKVQDVDTMSNAVGTLSDLVGGANKSSLTDLERLKRLGRDTAGLKTEKRYGPEPDPGAGIVKKSDQSVMGRLGRDTAGRKVHKAHNPKETRATRRADGTRPRKVV